MARLGTCITFISGSSAWGEPLPPHFQFPSRAQHNENKRIKISTFAYMKQIRGTFGNRDDDGTYKERDWGCTVGMNGKGGMDELEFAKFIKCSFAKQCIMFLPSLTKDTFGGKKLLATRFTVIFFKRPFIITKASGMALVISS